MQIEFKEITIREVVNGYVNNSEEGVIGYGGLLNIRPKYQREFVYKQFQRDAVITTIFNNFPLNTMYWVKNGNNYEVLDGQQRTISICEYVAGKFAINFQYFHNLEDDVAQQILDYKLMIYFCEGTDTEKLNWFKTINIAGEKLTDQELRNAVYTGQWLTDAKKYFSKTNCPAWNIGKDYLLGSPIRQEFLETVIDWVSGGNILHYMSVNQHKPNANEMWLYFNSVMNWVKTIFPKYRKEMKGINFGQLYDEFKNVEIDAIALENEINELMLDDEVTKKQGIYLYVLNRNEKHLNIRNFSEKQRREAFELYNGVCSKCGKTFKFDEVEADHITPWKEGGKTNLENLQILCKHCNRIKSDK